MSVFDPHEIPGYTEAVEQETANRELAFIGLDVLLCGQPARQFTFRHLLLLRQCGNAFICGKNPMPHDVAMFLWFVSPEYCLDQSKREAFVARLASLDMLECVMAIDQYLVDAFQDRIHGEDSRKPYYADVTELVATIAREFGWDDDRILDKPVARVLQYVKAIMHRNCPSLPLINPSDRLIGQWLRRRNEEAAAHAR